MGPLVSVIIPVYNRADTIQRAIDSVLNQSYRELELIVVDDDSTDNTVEIVRTYQDKRLRLLCLDNNRGANYARNTGIRAASGDYIAFQDSDDEWMADKLTIQLEYMLENNRKVSFSPYLLYDGTEVKTVPDLTENTTYYEDNMTDILRKRNMISTQTLMVCREVFQRAGIFDESFNRFQDYEFAIRLVQNYKIGCIKEPLVRVYRMKDSITNDKTALADACKKIMVKHVDFVDVESLMRIYLGSCRWFDADKIYWEYIDEVLDAFQKKIRTDEVEKCIRLKEAMRQWHLYFCEHIRGQKFIIYGAGNYGKELYRILKSMGEVPQCFWVTYKNKETREEIDGVDVIEIPDIADKTLSVIIAVSCEKREAMMKNLQSRGYCNFYVYSFL